ncbi:MAG: carbon-nitrogen family hydrolase [Planctomycetes bacterium]|nr:carbon-nitrogen family hydrolase [Planctomycetota bacterium]
MRVAGLQFDIAWEDPEENFRRVTPWLARAAADGASFVALPEMFATGFSMHAEEVSAHAGRVRTFCAEQAAQQGLWILAGMAEPGDPRPRNAAVLFDESGIERSVYHKIHPFSLAAEHEHYDGGSRLDTVLIGDLRVTVLICYDLRFPEPFRVAAPGTDLFCVIANWPERRSQAWKSLLRARAIENQAWVLGVNRVGQGGGLDHSGDSMLIDPMGEVRSAVCRDDALVGGLVTAEAVREARSRFSFLADRRLDVYDAIRRDRQS